MNRLKIIRLLPFVNSLLVILTCFHVPSIIAGQPDLSLDPIPNQINAIRFDPSYYYDSNQKVDKMSETLVKKWKESGINTVYYKAYDPIYGAKYRTSYDLNVEADYGRLDLLKHILRAAKKNDVKVLAWFPAFQHKAAWEKNPNWRIKTNDGRDYRPTKDSYFLCPANPHVRDWWLGLIREILERYEDLDGIDIAEPIINWNGHQCYCDACTKIKGEDLFTSKGLTETLIASVRLIHEYDKKASVTTVVSIHEDGGILSIQDQRDRTGFDLNGILDSKEKPDWLNVELMWQQWAELVQNKDIFTPEWTLGAAKSVKQQIDGRAKVIAHLEMTSFGQTKVDAEKLSRSIYSAKQAGMEHIDIYDSHLLDQQDAWDAIKEAMLFVSTKNILVYHDPRGENDAKQVASLLSHFKANIYTIEIDADNSVAPDFLDTDAVFIVGVDPHYQFPHVFLKALSDFDGTICWIHYGVGQFLEMNDKKQFGFEYKQAHFDSTYNSVLYKGYSLQRLDPAYHEVAILDSSTCHQLVAMTNGEKELPYVVRSGSFWYFADLPTAFVIEGGRHIVLSDLLHDIVREDHKPRKLALVRIEDISPLTDITSIKKIADYLESKKVPFSVALVPFYLNPELNEAATLSDVPDFVDAIHYLQKSGGSVIMHGSTHQYRGETTADYEFWDGMSGEALFSDSKESVRQKLLAGFSEFWKNKIYPIAWETPHYAASQMDYAVINNYFGTAYERRQTVDLHGSDQLLPYLIYNHTAGGKVIPENMGYIPLDFPDADPILKAAEKNLAIRDGVASFFFHPFVNHSVLKDLVPGLKKLGYQFTSPRLTENWVKTPYFNVLTMTGTMEIKLENEFYHEFFINEQGRIKNDIYSDSLVTGIVNKQVEVPEGWLFVAEKVTERPKGLMARFLSRIIPSIPKLTNSLIKDEEHSLIDENSLPINAAVLVDNTADGQLAIDQNNFVKALASVGVDVQRIDISTFLEVPDDINLLILSYSASKLINEQQNLFLLHALQNGLFMILEKNSVFSQNVGIVQKDNVVEVRNVIDEYFPQVGITWKEPDSLREFDVDIDYVSYYTDKKSELPIVIGGEYGEGKYLYFGTLFDPVTNGGYGRFPYFIDLIKRQFNLVPTLRRNQLEVYFEPGDREEISIEDLVKIWRSNGVRRIYVSAWHTYRDYTYDYARLLELAHQNAMSVYAWFELPHVSDTFWLDHPEWREKTATGDDAIVDWRKNMALNIPACQQAVFQEMRTLLETFEWDGINFAELYYESPRGYSSPELLTPMNDESRQLFLQQNGFDPIRIFEPGSTYFWKKNSAAVAKFNQFREDQIVELHRQFLAFLFNLEKKLDKSWEIMVTTIDDIYSPDIGEAIAVNTSRIADITKKYQFTLQIEDPQALWPLGPDRYTKLLDSYSNVKKEIPLILDINVVPYRDMNKTDASTAQPSGLELYGLARAAGKDGSRVALYSEASLYEVDFPIISHVMAAEAREIMRKNDWIVETPYTVSALLNADDHQDILVDGKIWPVYHRGRILLPAGKHTVEPVSRIKDVTNRFNSTTRLVNLSGELLSAQTISRGIKFEYDAGTVNWTILTEKPKEILIDNKKLEVEVMRGELGYSLPLPAGHHHVTIYTQSSGTQFMKHASMLISGFIIFLGVSAGFLLSVLYIRSSVRRKRAVHN